MMVNNQIRKVLWVPPPALPLPADDLARRIHGPRYDLAAVQQVVASGDAIRPMTPRVHDHLEDLAWDVDDVASLLQALTDADYHASEWAQVSSRMVVDADAYVIEYDHATARRRRLAQRYYVKFGFANNSLLLLLVSCHEEERGSR